MHEPARKVALTSPPAAPVTWMVSDRDAAKTRITPDVVVERLWFTARQAGSVKLGIPIDRVVAVRVSAAQ